MIRALALLTAAALCAVLGPQASFINAGTNSGPTNSAAASSPTSSSTFWPEGAPEDWARLDLSSLQGANTGFFCPMDRDVSSKTAGFCPRCGMKLVSGIPDPKEYQVHLTNQPPGMKAGEQGSLIFHIEDPKTPRPVRDFEIVHEKLYHVFLVSQDLSVFVHTHPELQPDASFRLAVRLPKPGMYRILSDFYPAGGTPQLIVNTLMVPGEGFRLAAAKLAPELSPQRADNVDVELITEPVQARAGAKTTLALRVKPNDGIEPYLGAMAHMLAASSDLIDMMHSHPIQVSDHDSEYKELQFKLTFPRAGTYRVWVQTQRRGVVNTVAFNIPVVK